MSRLLTSTEQISFLSRHPVIATRVAATKAVLAAGFYDDLDQPSWWNDEAWAFGFDPSVFLIPSYGIQVQDSTLGEVLIDPAPNGNIYFNTELDSRQGTRNLPYYQSPNPPGYVPPALTDLAWILGLAIGGAILLRGKLL